MVRSKMESACVSDKNTNDILVFLLRSLKMLGATYHQKLSLCFKFAGELCKR